MTASSRPPETIKTGLPPILASDLTSTAPTRGRWLWTIGPAYTAVFLWTPLLDILGRFLLSGTSLLNLLGVAVLAAIACYAFLFEIPATLGWRTGQRLTIVAASSLGTKGSEWLCGLGVGLASCVLYAISIDASIRITFLGMELCGFLSPSSTADGRYGPHAMGTVVFLATVAFWIFVITMTTILRIVGVIGALMLVYTPVALMLLIVTAGLTSSGLADFRIADLAAVNASGGPGANPTAAMCRMFQVIFGYFCLSGLIAVDWGMAVRDRRDVRIGGWISVVLVGAVALSCGLLTIAGAFGKQGIDLWSKSRLDPVFSEQFFRWSIYDGINGWTGGVILLLFGLATLAPACYASWTFTQRFARHWPKLRSGVWTTIGGLIAFLLVATKTVQDVEQIFGLLGAVFAPAVGVIVAEGILRREPIALIRIGWNRAGVLGWAIGVAVGLIPYVGWLFRSATLANFQPAALAAFFAGAIAYMVFARLVGQAPLLELQEAIAEGTSVPAQSRA